jgi:TDG/mug DNA glycosylase family protein
VTGAFGPWRITRKECLEGAGKAVPDLLGPSLRVLFVGINPSNCSGAAGFHFATPGNRFWPTLNGAGFTERQLRPNETQLLLASGIGITNLVNRATAQASLVDPLELRSGADRLRRTVRTQRPRAVAILGKGAYRIAFAEPVAELGRQANDLEGSPLWILPNPSGLNAHYTVARLVEQFAAMRRTLGW